MRRPLDVVYFGQIRPKRGVEEFLELAEHSFQVLRPFNFLMVGTAPQKHAKYYQRLRDRTRASVQWLTNLPLDDIAQVLASSLAAYLPFPYANMLVGRTARPRCGAFADEPRTVSGDAGSRTRDGRRRAGSRFSVMGLAYALQNVSWPPAAHGSCRSVRFPRLELEPIAPLHTRRAHRHLPLRYARTLRTRSSMRGASWPATTADGWGRETLVRSRGQCGSADTTRFSR